MHEMQADRVHMHFDLLAEGIGQAGKAPHSHAYGQVRALDMRR